MKIKGLKKKKKKIQKYIKELPPAYERHRIVLEKVLSILEIYLKIIINVFDFCSLS